MKMTFRMEAVDKSYESFIRDPEIHVSTKHVSLKKFEETLGIVHVANFFNRGRYVIYNITDENKFRIARAKYGLW